MVIYTVAALHRLNNTIAKGFNQMAPPARTITVALDMSKAFSTVNIHTLIGKLLQTSAPGTVIKFIANYIKGRKEKSEITNPYIRFKLAFLKVACYHPPYLTPTQQISHTHCTGTSNVVCRGHYNHIQTY